jgi:hypothetical protein
MRCFYSFLFFLGAVYIDAKEPGYPWDSLLMAVGFGPHINTI